MARRPPAAWRIAALVPLVLAACTQAPPVDPDRSQPDSPANVADESEAAWKQQGGPLVVGRTMSLSDSTVTLAQQNGWFEEFGLDVEIVDVRATTDLIPSFLAGDLDVIPGGIQAGLVAAIGSGEPIRAVATLWSLSPDQCSSYGLMMLPEAAERFDAADAAALRRLRIGGPFQSGFTGLWFVDRLAASVGLELDDLDLRTVTTADSAATLIGGGVDAVLTVDPTMTRIREEIGGVEVLPVAQILPDRVLLLLYFGPRLLEDRELAARYLAVHLLAAERHAEGPTKRNLSAMTAAMGIEPDLLAEMCWSAPDPSSRPYEAVVLEAMRFAESIGQLDVVPTPQEFWDHDIQDRARELLRASGR
jgi:NitT/TauT family transport system substrate-binding protein